MSYETVIGMEVHAQLKTNTKLFCGCSTQFGHQPNENVCPVCLGMPGALPVLNKRAVEFAIKAGIALHCQINPISVFARKNYFYPDLPKGYQISQFELPICEKGYLDIDVDGQVKRIGITRIHMEEDAGKLVHQGSVAIAGATGSLVDLNRACVPLIEIVSEPDLRSAKEAKAYMEALKQIVQYIGVCDGNLEEGSLRADANISLRPKGDSTFGTRTEIKNMNSFRSLERAILSEVTRQTQLLQAGERVIQQTRHYDDVTQTTRPLRSKEESHDYRYFPDPDLLPLVVTEETVGRLSAELPELPDQKRVRYRDVYQLSEPDIAILVQDPETCAFFEKCLQINSALSPKDVAKWMLGDTIALQKETKKTLLESKLTPENLTELISLVADGTISSSIGKNILADVFNTGESPKSLVAKKGGGQISDTSAIQAVVDKVLAENPDVVEKIKGGKANSADFLMGQVMRHTKGMAKPDLVRELILKTISKS